MQLLLKSSLLLTFLLMVTFAPVRLEPITVYPSHSHTNMGFALGDINGNGRPDLAVQPGGWGGPLLWYEHIKGKSWAKHTIAGQSPEATHFAGGDTALGDFDNDGDLDVLGFAHPGEWQYDYTGDTITSVIYWFENLRGGQAWQPHLIGPMPDFVKDVELADFNGDGLLDLVAITHRDEHWITVYQQTTGGGWEKSLDRTIYNLHEGLDCGDIDGDGDLDIATNGFWIENPAQASTGDWIVRVIDHRWHTQTSGNRRANATRVVCTDFDTDGKSEVVIAHAEDSGYPVLWYDNDYPRAKPWKTYLVAQGLAGIHTLEAADIDQDGDTDLLVAENGDHRIETDDNLRQVRLFLNRGDNRSWGESVIANDGLFNGLLHDINNDDQLDICGPTGHEGKAYRVRLLDPED